MEHFAFNRDTVVSLQACISLGKWIRTGVSGDSYWSVANGISHDGNVEGIFIIYFSVLENMLKVSPRLCQNMKSVQWENDSFIQVH